MPISHSPLPQRRPPDTATTSTLTTSPTATMMTPNIIRDCPLPYRTYALNVSRTGLQQELWAPNANMSQDDPSQEMRMYYSQEPDTSDEIEETIEKTFGNQIRIAVAGILTAITKNKNVTKIDKTEVQRLANAIKEETDRFVTFLSTVASSSHPHASSTTAAATQTEPIPSDSTNTVAAVRETIREEFEKISIREHVNRADGHLSSSYASIAGHEACASHATIPTSPRIPPTRHAITITNKTHTVDAAETLKAWKRSVSFQNTNYAPAVTKLLSNGKVRVEFDNAEQRDLALLRTNTNVNGEVRAEPARALKPMFIIKGIPKEVANENLTEIIINQNPCIEKNIGNQSDLSLHFVKNNKNPYLYNAVYLTTPTIFRSVVTAGRLNIDHQRVHASEHIPLLQCYSCLQYGHTRRRCSAAVTICSHCASSSHLYQNCPHKIDPSKAECHNCATQNRRNNKTSNKHSATSTKCPQMIQMINLLKTRIDYGQE